MENVKEGDIVFLPKPFIGCNLPIGKNLVVKDVQTQFGIKYANFEGFSCDTAPVETLTEAYIPKLGDVVRERDSFGVPLRTVKKISSIGNDYSVRFEDDGDWCPANNYHKWIDGYVGVDVGSRKDVGCIILGDPLKPYKAYIHLDGVDSPSSVMTELSKETLKHLTDAFDPITGRLNEKYRDPFELNKVTRERVWNKIKAEIGFKKEKICDGGIPTDSLPSLRDMALRLGQNTSSPSGPSNKEVKSEIERLRSKGCHNLASALEGEMRSEALSDIADLKKMIKALKDPDIGVSVSVGGLKDYGLSNNKAVIKLLKKEIKEIKKFLKGKPNNWE